MHEEDKGRDGGGPSQAAASQQQQDEEDSSSDDEAPSQRKAPGENYIQKMNAEEIERKVKDIVRLALAMEHRRQPLKREDVVKKVLKEHGRAFEPLFKMAQERLRDIFGMELVKLPVRERKVTMSQAVRRGANKDKAASSSKSYVLRTIVPGEEREGMTKWGDESPYMVLLCIVLSLIYVHDRVITDTALNMHLRRLHLRKDHPHPVFGSVDQALALFCKQGYLIKSKSTEGEHGGDREVWEYVAGPRAKVEFPDENVVGFIMEMYPDVEGGARLRLEKDIIRAGGVAGPSEG
ncbi:hypothetical protein HK104_008805 [Borealophlyctis nickersoniae]|nr:hypothetical protein HK104_008805 [Borealophlyctis nickersoniae]